MDVMTENNLVPKLRFKEFKDAWNFSKTEDLFDFKNGLNKEKEFFGKGTPIINFKDVYKLTSIRKKDIMGLVELTNSELSRFSAIDGDVFFTRTSETIHDIGMSATLVEPIENCVFSGFVLRARPKTKSLSKYFTAHLFSIESVRKEITTKSSMTTRALTSGTLLNKVYFHFPSISEQQKIASFLSAVDEKLKQLTKKKELLEDYKKGVMQKIFSQELRFKDEFGNNYPDCVELHLFDFLLPEFRERYKPICNYLAIGIRSHCKGTFQKPNSDPLKIAMEKLFLVKENDLIVNITFAWEGAIALVKKEDEGGYVSHRFPTYLFIRSIVLYEFFKYIMVKKNFRHQLNLKSPGGAGRNRVLNKKEFLKIKVNIPSIEEQKKIANFLTSLDSKIDLVSTQIENTKAFKKGLLQQMFV